MPCSSVLRSRETDLPDLLEQIASLASRKLLHCNGLIKPVIRLA